MYVYTTHQQHFLLFSPAIGESAIINFLPPMLIRSLRDLPPGGIREAVDFCLSMRAARATNMSSRPNQPTPKQNGKEVSVCRKQLRTDIRISYATDKIS